VVQSLAPVEEWSASADYSLDIRSLVTDLIASLETQLGKRVEGAIGAVPFGFTARVAIAKGNTIVVEAGWREVVPIGYSCRA
jgi:hypothetical protein